MSSVLLFGPSRAGKSSFINTVARNTLAPVGGSNNESTTNTVNSYNVNVRTQNNNNIPGLLLIDPPGLSDSKIRMSDSEIKTRIEEKLLTLTTQDSLSCILVFESLASEPTHLRSTLSNLEGLLGPNFKQSVIVILTKADMVKDVEELQGAKKTAEEICKNFGMPYIYWTNNHHQFKVDEQVFSQQVGELKSKMASVSRYSMQGVKYYHQRIQERARALERSTPKQTRTEYFEVVSTEMRPYTVQVTKYRTVEHVRWKLRGGFAGMLGQEKSYIAHETEEYTENETRYQPVEVRQTRSREVEIPFGPNHFVPIAKNEMLNEIRSKYR